MTATVSAVPSRPMRITIIEDHVLFAEAVALTLEREGFLVRRIDLHKHTTLAAVLAAALRGTPRMVMLDLDLGTVGSGIKLIPPLATAGASVVVVTGSSEKALHGECLRRGAKAVMLKTSLLHDVVNIVRRVRDGRPLMNPDERAELIAIARQDRNELHDIRSRLDRLTRREQEILGSLMSGETVREIAQHGVVAEATVRTQVKSILAKLDMTSQLAAVGAAHRAGWHAPSPAR